jgi:hypothetical protein
VDWIEPFVFVCCAAAVLGYVINRWVVALVPAVVGIPVAWLLVGSCEVGPHSFATDCDANAIAHAFWTFLWAAVSLAMLVAIGIRRWRASGDR